MAGEDLEKRLAPQGGSELEKKAEKSDWTFWNVARDVALYSPLAVLAYAIGGPASLLTPIGLGIGKYLTNRKKKQKTTWKDMRRTLAVGNFGGALAYWAYKVPDLIMGTPLGLTGMIAKTLLFNPIMLAPWMAWYRTTNYIVGKYGVWGTIKSMFDGKIFGYIKEAYNEDLKKKYWSTMAEAFLTISPIHFYSMNYLHNPTYRVALGTVNDVILSTIAGEEGLLRNIKKKLIYTAPEKEPNIVKFPTAEPQYLSKTG
ncbi:MAG TPA: hypothetical protein VFF28_03670 [Candidatus Nanoarchaeia archaeon]|nr:hypothetical protein [Candidatus Nanoarchaeia archaeon]